MYRYVKKITTDADQTIIETNAELIARKLGVSIVVALVLAQRGMNVDDAQSFLYSSFPDMHSPFLFSQMQTAVDRIYRAKDNNEIITVYGDYDVDGVCASVALTKSLLDNNYTANYYIPSRHKEGYGLCNEAIDAIADNGTTLIITVDCGITATSEIDYANKKGIDVIVTDHHQPHDELPNAVACICAWIEEEGYPFKDLCGAGVSGKLIHALFGIDQMKKHIGIIALATIADLVPIVGENRIIVKEGLHDMQACPLVGIKALCNEAGIEYSTLNAGNLGYALGPRINASGRMGDATIAANLLFTDDVNKANELAKELENENRKRKSTEEKIFSQAMDKAAKLDVSQMRALVLQDDEWDHGVIGIVASKLVEKFCMPVILFSKDGEEYKGSGRSVEGVNLFSCLQKLDEFFVKYGGHEQAAGMTVSIDKFDEFCYKFEEIIRFNHDEDCFLPKLSYDGKISIDDISQKLAKDIELLEPFGMGNSTPTFLLEAPVIKNVSLIGANKNHARFSISSSSTEIECVAFNSADEIMQLGKNQSALIRVIPQINRFAGRERLQCQVKSIDATIAAKEPEKYVSGLRANFTDAICKQILYNDINCQFFDPDRTLDIDELFEHLGYMLNTNSRGTIIICNTEYGAKSTLHLLNKMGVLDNLKIFVNEQNGNAAMFNSIMIAPYNVKECIKKFDEVIVMDMLPIIANNDNVWQCGAFFNEEALKTVKAAVLNRKQLLVVFSALKELLKMQVTYESMNELAEVVSQKTTFRVSQVMLALKVFNELKLFKGKRMQTGWLFAVSPKSGGVELSESKCYNRMMEYINMTELLIESN